MPFSTAGQEWIFLGCLLTGLIMGVVYDALFILRFCCGKLFKESKTPAPPPNANAVSAKPESRKLFRKENLPSLILTFAADMVFFGVCFVLILFSAKITADGQIFWFSAAAYVLGFILERISLGIIVAKFVNMIYNTLAKALERLKKKPFT